MDGILPEWKEPGAAWGEANSLDGLTRAIILSHKWHVVPDAMISHNILTAMRLPWARLHEAISGYRTAAASRKFSQFRSVLRG
jgi:hypothetical protein